MCVWAISPSLFMERRQKHQEPEAEKSRPVMYWCFCNNILEVVFLVKVFESGTWGGQPRRALTVQMVTALQWFCLWGAKMETFGIRMSHTYRSQDGQSLRTHTHIQFVCPHEHTNAQAYRGYKLYLDCTFVSPLHTPVSWRSGHKHPVHKDVLKKCNLKNTHCTYKHFFYVLGSVIIFMLKGKLTSDLDVIEQATESLPLILVILVVIYWSACASICFLMYVRTMNTVQHVHFLSAFTLHLEKCKLTFCVSNWRQEAWHSFSLQMVTCFHVWQRATGFSRKMRHLFCSGLITMLCQPDKLIFRFSLLVSK